MSTSEQGEEMTFPNRPDHPDFWALSAIVQDYDVAAEEGHGVDRLVASIGDSKSVGYMALGRGKIFYSKLNPLMAPTPSNMIPAMASAWLDGFVAGAMFQKKKEES